MCEDKACSPEDSLEIRRQVQALDAASAANRLREEKTYEDHGRNVLNLFHGPSLRAMLTAIAAGRRTGERRVAGPSTVQVLEGEVRFRAGGGATRTLRRGDADSRRERALRGGGLERRRLPAHSGAADQGQERSK